MAREKKEKGRGGKKRGEIFFFEKLAKMLSELEGKSN